jgi:SAM-dependent methyltransferase
MKTVLQYIRFFFYVALNWNLPLAFFVLYHDIRGALKYRIKTFVPVPLTRLNTGNADISKSSPYEAVNYYMLERLLAVFRRLSALDSIVDLGCGKGRVMVVAAHFGFIRITGIDFASELCAAASANMKKTQEKFPGLSWKVINLNVLDYPIQPGDKVFFMFNPFDQETLVRFLGKLEQSCKTHPRKTYFIYASPQHLAVLESRGYQVIYRRTLLNLKGVILEKENI